MEPLRNYKISLYVKFMIVWAAVNHINIEFNENDQWIQKKSKEGWKIWAMKWDFNRPCTVQWTPLAKKVAGICFCLSVVSSLIRLCSASVIHWTQHAMRWTMIRGRMMMKWNMKKSSGSRFLHLFSWGFDLEIQHFFALTAYKVYGLSIHCTL